jgi:hypothetical protein
MIFSEESCPKISSLFIGFSTHFIKLTEGNFNTSDFINFTLSMMQNPLSISNNQSFRMSFIQKMREKLPHFS